MGLEGALRLSRRFSLSLLQQEQRKVLEGHLATVRQQIEVSQSGICGHFSYNSLITLASLLALSPQC